MEEWRPIYDFENYQISSLGQILSPSGKILKPRTKSKTKYLIVDICKEGKTYTKRIHQLVALTFIENPENKPTIDHINKNPTDNRVCNLRWATHSEQNINRSIQNKSGYKFIQQQGNRYYCYVVKNQLESFDTLEEAIAYRDKVLAQNTVDES